MVAFVRGAPAVVVVVVMAAAGTGLARGVPVATVAVIIVACLLPSMSAVRLPRAGAVVAVVHVSTFPGVMASSGLLAVRRAAVAIVVASPLPHVAVARFPVPMVSAAVLVALFAVFGLPVMFVPRVARAPLAVVVFLVMDGSRAMASLMWIAMGAVPIRSVGLSLVVVMVMGRWVPLCLLVGLGTGLAHARRHAAARAADTVPVRLVPWMCRSAGRIAARLV